MKRERDRIINKAKAKRKRKMAKRKPNPAEEQPSADLTTQVQEVASALSEKVGNIVESATEAIKTAVTKKRFHATKQSPAPSPSPSRANKPIRKSRAIRDTSE
jgi:hypothetical protein